MPNGRQDILNIALGRPDHPGRVRVAGHGVTISHYFGEASCGSNTSSATITPHQLVEMIGNLKEEWKREVEEENIRSIEIMKKELKEAIKTLTPSRCA